MKLVVFSDIYPPSFIGGYEIGASWIVDELRRRGHEVLLLSAHDYYLYKQDSLVKVSQPDEAKAGIVDVGPCLFAPLLRNCRRLASPEGVGLIARGFLCTRPGYLRAIEAFAPDAFLCFNPAGVVAPVLDDFVRYSEKTGVPVCVYVSDGWVSTWPIDNPLFRAVHRFRHSPRRSVRLLEKGTTKLLSAASWLTAETLLVDEFFYCSEFIRTVSRQNATPAAGHTVAHWGLPTEQFLEPLPIDRFHKTEPLTLVYAGQIEEHKGLAAVIKALSRCTQKHRLIVFGDDATSYAAACKELAGRLRVENQLVFAGRRDPVEMPALLRQAGEVLVMPSSWDEPFSIVLLQGLALGMTVVASHTGGTAEAITSGRTGFLFDRGQFKQLATVLNRIEADRTLCCQVAVAGRQSAERRFRLEFMVDRILERLAHRSFTVQPSYPRVSHAKPSSRVG